MSTNGGSDRVSNKQLYDALTELRDQVPTRREMRLTVAVAFLGGQALASAVTAYVTHLTPPQQVRAIAAFVLNALST